MAPAKTADKAAATAKPLATKVTKETRPRRTTTRSSGGIKYRKRAQTKKANSEPEVLTIDDDNDDDDDDDDVFNVEPSKPPVKGQGAKGKAELEKPVKEKSGPKIIKSIETPESTWKAKYNALVEIRQTKPEQLLEELQQAYNERQRDETVSDALIDSLEKELSEKNNADSSTNNDDLIAEIRNLREGLSSMQNNFSALSSAPRPLEQPQKEQEQEPPQDLDFAFGLISSLAGIQVTEIEYTNTSAIYKCIQSGRLGELKYTLTVLLEEMAEPQFEITYLPSKDRSNKKVLALLPEYYSEGLAFSSESELEFLKDSNVITPAFFDQLTNKLPARVESGQPPIDLITSDSNNTRSNNNEKQYPPNNSAPPAGPPAYQQNHNDHNGQEVVEVLYNYRPDGPTDLALHPGQRLVIVNKLNNDWWRGKDLQTEKEGIFPANYVKPINGGNNNNNYNNNDMSRQAYNPPPPSGAPSGPPPGPPGNNNNNYYPPPPQQQQYQPPPQQYNNNYYQPPYPPPSTNYYPPPQQQQQQQAPQPQQPQQQEQAPAPAAEHSNAFADGAKKIGGKLGNAAIFGAGSTLGSNLVNSIF